MTGTIRSVATSLAAVVAALILCLPVTVNAGIHLLTSTLLVMGGNENPAALTPAMQQELGGDPYYPAPNTNRFKPAGTFGHGYIDTQNNPDSPFYGWDFRPVEWPAQIGLPILGSLTYEASQQQGVQNLDRAIDDTVATLSPGEKAVAFGYSSSANVVVREMRGLQNEPGGAPATDQLEFYLLGNPNRPNGGIMQRFPGLYIPFVGIRLDGSTPVDTPYATTDIAWEYDTVADFPIYPLNILADLNALIPGPILHGNYYPADINGPRAFPDTTVGNITYVTLKPPHLPLLLPLYYIGFPKPLLDLVEPALTVMVNWGYDRSISPGTPTTARLIPRINPVTAARDLAEAVAEGVHQFRADLTPPAATAPAPAVARGALRQVSAAETATSRNRKSAGSRPKAAARASASAAAASPGRHIRPAS